MAPDDEGGRDALPDLRGPRVLLRGCRPEHRDRLRALHGHPAVRRWWNEPSDAWPDDVEAGTRPYAVLLVTDGLTADVLKEGPDGAPADGPIVGFVQWYEETDPHFRHAGLDLFLDPAVHGRGLGREVVTVVCAHLVDDHGFHRLVIDPAVDNTAAVACYRRVGFRDVGVMRRYGLGADGAWHDGLLLDLLAGELDRSAMRPRSGSA